MDRSRFKSLWNGTATIIFFAGLFIFNSEILGFSTFGIAIFMWILGGTVRNMIYGSKNNTSPNPRSKSINNDTTCPVCGMSVLSDSQFCSECGASLDKPVK